jgi:pimeloyl-ACP methyl ester carboxylesterase
MEIHATDGATLHVDVMGSGAPLLLLHGLTGSGRDWAHALDLEALASAHRLVVPDARGHGRSTMPPGSFSFQRCARDVLEILDALQLEEVRAIGMSLGAKTLLHVACGAPERLHAMVLVSAAPRFPPATRDLFRAFAAQTRTDEERAAMRLAHVFGDAQIDALWSLPARFAADPSDHALTAADLARGVTPTLLVAGDADPLYPLALAEELQRDLRHASLHVVQGGGHVPVFGDDRAPFEERVLAFLAEHAPRATDAR